MEVLILTSPHEAPEPAAQALAARLNERGKRVGRSSAGDDELVVLSLPLNDVLARSDEFAAHATRSFMMVRDDPSAFASLEEAARRTREARKRGARFVVDHWVLTETTSEESVWSFDHHCAPCRVAWTIPSASGQDFDKWAEQVIEELQLAPRNESFAAELPAKLSFPGSDLDKKSASRFTYVFDAQELGNISGDVMPVQAPVTAPAVRSSVPSKARGRPAGISLIAAGIAAFVAAGLGALFLL